MKKYKLLLIIAFFSIIQLCCFGFGTGMIFAQNNENFAVALATTSSFSEEHEVGKTFSLPLPDSLSDCTIDASVSWGWSVKWPNGSVYSYTTYTKSFTPT